MSYAYTHLTHKTITDNINFMHLYYEIIRVLLLITGLRLFGSPVGVTELILMQNLCLSQLMFIRDSRRSYRSYPYSELILITDLFLFGTPIGVTELILIQNLYL